MLSVHHHGSSARGQIWQIEGEAGQHAFPTSVEFQCGPGGVTRHSQTPESTYFCSVSLCGLSLLVGWFALVCGHVVEGWPLPLPTSHFPSGREKLELTETLFSPHGLRPWTGPFWGQGKVSVNWEEISLIGLH